MSSGADVLSSSCEDGDVEENINDFFLGPPACQTNQIIIGKDGLSFRNDPRPSAVGSVSEISRLFEIDQPFLVFP